MSKTRPLIAVLDDEPRMCHALARLLKTYGFMVETFSFGEDLLASCAVQLPDCLLLDLHMPGISGFEVLERFAAQHLPVPVIVITAHDQPGNDKLVQSLGAVCYLLKPLDESRLLAAIRAILKVDALRQFDEHN